MNHNEVSVFTVADMAFSSLWFLGACMQKENLDRSVRDVYMETLGKAEISVPVFNVGTGLLGAYSLFVLPRGLLFDEFSKALTGKGKLDWTGFTWTEPDRFGPDPNEQNWQGAKSDHNVLGGIRNALAHANFEVEIAEDGPVILHLWSQSGEQDSQKRNVRVSPSDLAKFATQFHKMFVEWHDNGKKFVAPVQEPSTEVKK